VLDACAFEPTGKTHCFAFIISFVPFLFLFSFFVLWSFPPAAVNANVNATASATVAGGSTTDN
jgi:uncharacterized membrane protein (DUF485 family)